MEKAVKFSLGIMMKGSDKEEDISRREKTIEAHGVGPRCSSSSICLSCDVTRSMERNLGPATKLEACSNYSNDDDTARTRGRKNPMRSRSRVDGCLVKYERYGVLFGSAIWHPHGDDDG